MELINTEVSLAAAAAKAGMDEKTARKYLAAGKLPSELKAERGSRHWRTRADTFEEVWADLRSALELNPGLEAKTLFEDLQRRFPGRFADSQLRTLQRRVKAWRALEGPAKEVFFEQEHRPGVLSQSDFTHMGSLGVRIAGERFEHLVYHFVLTYSNWETVSICFSESFESLSEGLQRALWELGGVPRAHRTDRLTAAVHKVEHPEEFTSSYAALLRHYGLAGEKIQAGKAHENGDVEQRHHRFKRALEQALLLRGSRDFAERAEYERFLRQLLEQLNAGRRQRLEEEIKVLGRLPAARLDTTKQVVVKVSAGSTIRVQHNTYSVHSRLIGERVTVRIRSEALEVLYAQRLVESLPRLRGENRQRIDYRHVIEWLVRKPGAFANYRYRQDLFPTSRFRQAYDALRERGPSGADKEYLRILELAASEGEAVVNNALGLLLDAEQALSLEVLRELVRGASEAEPVCRVEVPPVDLADYDTLLEERRAAI
jgi:hypothetical protein